MRRRIGGAGVDCKDDNTSNGEVGNRIFNMKSYWGESSKRPYVIFKRNSPMLCVYCGLEADTREHCPPRFLFDLPLPKDLQTIPACRTCNNGFSADENYVKFVLNDLFKHYELNDDSFQLVQENECIEEKEAREASLRFIQNPFFDTRMERIFRKIAIGHVNYELSIQLFCDERLVETARVSYVIRPMLDEDEWNQIGCCEDITNDVLPEVGSRAYGNIYIVETCKLQNDGTKRFEQNARYIEWTSLQEDNYKYVAFLRENNIIVRMLYRNFLFVEVVFQGEE